MSFSKESHLTLFNPTHVFDPLPHHYHHRKKHLLISMACVLENALHYEPSLANLEKAALLGPSKGVRPTPSGLDRDGQTWHRLGQWPRVLLEPKSDKTLRNRGSLKGNYGSVSRGQASLGTSQSHLEPNIPLLLMA